MRLRIVGSDLPGGSCGDYTGVQVGVQRRTEVVDAVSADAESVVFDLDVAVVDTDDGADFRGPFVHGQRGGRFVYLVWTHTDASGKQVMFRRAKLLLAPVAALVSAADAGQGVVGTLALTDAYGAPVCAPVTPPAITWQVAA